MHGYRSSVLMHSPDTNIDAFQGDTVHLIETSGRTLLDTLDHVHLPLHPSHSGCIRLQLDTQTRSINVLTLTAS